MTSFSFRAKMILCFGITFLVAVVTAGIVNVYGIPVIGYEGEYGRTLAESIKSLNAVADTAKRELLHLIRERQGDAETFCESPIIRETVRVACQESGAASTRSSRAISGHLHALQRTYQSLYAKLAVVDARTRRVIASTDGTEVGLETSPFPDFEEVREGFEIETISFRRDADGGSPYITILHGIRDGASGAGEGRIIAVLMLYLKPHLFLKMLEEGETKFGETGEIFLVDEEGTPLTALASRPRASGSSGSGGPSLPATAAGLAAGGAEGLIETNDARGVPVLAAFRHVRVSSELGWGMIVKKDRAEIFSSIRRMIIFFTLNGLILFLIVLGTTWIIASRLTRPIRLLSSTAGRVEEGDFSARSGLDGSDEIGVLSRSFDSMVERIRNWHRQLEEEVRARTVDLSREVEERRRAEEALRVSEIRFRELMENAHMVAIVLDRKGCITFCNDYLLNLTGWTRQEVIGGNWFELFLPDDISGEVRELFTAAVEAGDIPPHFENPIVTRNGRRHIIVWDNNILRGVDGSVTGTASLGTDVTEQRSLEEQLRHSQKMEAIGQLAGGVAHDFNNLLTTIIGYGSLLQRKLKEEDPLRKYADHIMMAGERATTVTQGLLAYSRRQALELQSVDINSLLCRMDDFLSRIIGEDIELTVIPSLRPLRVMADASQIEQVLMNLAANARDAMRAHGSIVISATETDTDEFLAAQRKPETGPYGVISVRDTGCGMDDATREKIFEPFFTTKEIGKGTGLGLSIVYGIIRQHRGFINVRSERGHGTTFDIYLPLTDEPVSEDREDAALDAAGNGETILVVEDNGQIRSFLRDLLSERGYRVIEAGDGEEGVRQFFNHREEIDLILMDVVMPQKNGKEAYDEIRACCPEVKALFMSGYAADIIGRKGIDPLHLDLLSKPFSPVNLLLKIREKLSRATNPAD